MSSQPSAGLPVRAMHAGRPSLRTTAPSFGQPPPTRRARIQLVANGRRAFAVVGPTVSNALGNDLHDSDLSITSFGRLLNTKLFSSDRSTERSIETLCDNAPYKLTLNGKSWACSRKESRSQNCQLSLLIDIICRCSWQCDNYNRN